MKPKIEKAIDILNFLHARRYFVKYLFLSDNKRSLRLCIDCPNELDANIIFTFSISKENLVRKNCRRKLQLRTRNNIVRKVKICSDKRFRPCLFVSNKYSNESISFTKSRGKTIMLANLFNCNLLHCYLFCSYYIFRSKGTKEWNNQE